jgi:hypothetical protein
VFTIVFHTRPIGVRKLLDATWTSGGRDPLRSKPLPNLGWGGSECARAREGPPRVQEFLDATWTSGGRAPLRTKSLPNLERAWFGVCPRPETSTPRPTTFGRGVDVWRRRGDTKTHYLPQLPQVTNHYNGGCLNGSGQICRKGGTTTAAPCAPESPHALGLPSSHYSF